LQEAAVGFGAMAVNSMLQRDALFAADATSAKERIYDLKPKLPHFAPKAKRVIFIYIGGGPSTIDMFDPKPTLMKYDGKPAPFEIKGRALNGSQQIMASPWKFANCGQSGQLLSCSVFPESSGQGNVRTVHDHRSHRPLHSPIHLRYRPRLYRLPIHRLVGQLCPRQRKPASPGIRRIGARRHHWRSGTLFRLAASYLQRHLDARRSQDADL
jgi:hypothetical protein